MTIGRENVISHLLFKFKLTHYHASRQWLMQFLLEVESPATIFSSLVVE